MADCHSRATSARIKKLTCSTFYNFRHFSLKIIVGIENQNSNVIVYNQITFSIQRNSYYVNMSRT